MPHVVILAYSSTFLVMVLRQEQALFQIENLGNLKGLWPILQCELNLNVDICSSILIVPKITTAHSNFVNLRAFLRSFVAFGKSFERDFTKDIHCCHSRQYYSEKNYSVSIFSKHFSFSFFEAVFQTSCTAELLQPKPWLSSDFDLFAEIISPAQPTKCVPSMLKSPISFPEFQN